LLWTQRLDVVRGHERTADSVSVRLGGRSETTVEIDDLERGPRSQPPLYVLPTGGGIGYGEFVLDPGSRTYLTRHLADVPDALTRGAALVTLWEEMLGGRVPPRAMFDAIVDALPRETDELTIQRMLGYTQQAFWKFLAPGERDGVAPAFERLLRAGLDRAGSSSLKSAWFNALRDMARTPATVQWLERIWNKSETVPGLVLAEPDYITLALELAVREIPAWPRVLEEQRGRIENADRRAQFDFVRPALSADPATRDRFFASLADVKNRNREAWVLQAIGYLHHPLRAASAEKYIGPSLALLREIQQTGDIFFPKRWMDATLGGHQSASAAQQVSAFLGNLPKGYPERLQRIILSSSDDLIRARRIRER
jgi:aminopeptidase N